MTYSCSDFTDSILDALEIEVPQISADSPSDQADAALARIERLQAIESAASDLLEALPEMSDFSDEIEKLRAALLPVVFAWPEEESDDQG